MHRVLQRLKRTRLEVLRYNQYPTEIFLKNNKAIVSRLKLTLNMIINQTHQAVLKVPVRIWKTYILLWPETSCDLSDHVTQMSITWNFISEWPLFLLHVHRKSANHYTTEPFFERQQGCCFLTENYFENDHKLNMSGCTKSALLGFEKHTYYLDQSHHVTFLIM